MMVYLTQGTPCCGQTVPGRRQLFSRLVLATQRLQLKSSASKQSLTGRPSARCMASDGSTTSPAGEAAPSLDPSEAPADARYLPPRRRGRKSKVFAPGSNGQQPSQGYHKSGDLSTANEEHSPPVEPNKGPLDVADAVQNASADPNRMPARAADVFQNSSPEPNKTAHEVVGAFLDPQEAPNKGLHGVASAAHVRGPGARNRLHGVARIAGRGSSKKSDDSPASSHQEERWEPPHRRVHHTMMPHHRPHLKPQQQLQRQGPKEQQHHQQQGLKLRPLHQQQLEPQSAAKRPSKWLPRELSKFWGLAGELDRPWQGPLIRQLCLELPEPACFIYQVGSFPRRAVVAGGRCMPGDWWTRNCALDCAGPLRHEGGVALPPSVQGGWQYFHHARTRQAWGHARCAQRLMEPYTESTQESHRALSMHKEAHSQHNHTVQR